MVRHDRSPVRVWIGSRRSAWLTPRSRVCTVTFTGMRPAAVGATGHDEGTASGGESAPPSEAKLAPPRIPPGILMRERLFAALDGWADAGLTLVSGPAGAGKTMLVCSWLASKPDVSKAWVTLDPGDDDPVRLWTHIADAVDRARPGIAQPALRRLRTPRAGIESSLDELLNGLARDKGRLIIVLDDLHHALGEPSLRLLVYVVERLPRGVRIVATTRSDPGRRLGRLRARGALGELRARDLAFSVDEAGAVLGRAGVSVDDVEVEALVERTEGWPAGIGLAALWLAGSDTPTEEIRQFSADHRHVTDYLASEVLDALDDKGRGFLLSTSIFERFTAELCDSVLGSDDARDLLADLERSNLFLIGLDSRGVWYRYHHLFREVLRIDLARLGPGEEARLHRRAADWFLANGLVEEALAHAAAASDTELATLLAVVQMDLIRGGRMDVFMRWLERLPQEELVRHPTVPALGALVAAVLAQPAAKTRRLATLAHANSHTLVEQEQHFIDAAVAMTFAALLDHDLGSALDHAIRAVDVARGQVEELAVAALAVLAYVYYLRGDAARARRSAEEAVGRPDAPHRPHGLVHAEALLALLECDAGHPRTAESRARRAVGLAADLGLAGIWSAALPHHALGQALLALGHQQEAERELVHAETLRRAVEPRLDHAHSLLALAGARIERGRLALAASELEAAREELAAFSDVGRLAALAEELEQKLATARAGTHSVGEQPSLAELTVLRMLATDLTQREIGAELYLSTNTVKTHTRRLYTKLGVNSRESAIHQASALGLLETDDSPG